jgi:hypothetical protein
MITTAILEIIYLFIKALEYPIKSLPDVSLPSNIASAISSAGGYLASFDLIFPVSTFLTIFGLILTIEAAILVYKIVMWLIKKIPTIS